MHYSFLEGQNLFALDEVFLPPEEINHVYRVLRLKVGDIIVAADGLGAGRLAEIKQLSSQQVLVSLHEPVQERESPLKITLFQSLLKGDKMDLVIRQAVELGVNSIIPLISDRTIPVQGKEQNMKKILRWRKKVRSAAAQCRRLYLPSLEPIQELKSVLPRLEEATTLVPWEEEKNLLIGEVLKRPCPQKRVVFLFIGPEGGFTEAEVEALRNVGAETVSLGLRIMRSETAAAAVLALLQAGWGDLSGEG